MKKPQEGSSGERGFSTNSEKISMNIALGREEKTSDQERKSTAGILQSSEEFEREWKAKNNAFSELDGQIQEIAKFYDKPFSELPPSEQFNIAYTVISHFDYPAGVFDYPNGAKVFDEICHLIKCQDYMAVGVLFRKHMIDSAGAETYYNMIRGDLALLGRSD